MNRQLTLNIKQLDLLIAKLSTQIKEQGNGNGYESKVGTLTDLINLRSQLVKAYNNESSDVIVELDRQIEELTIEVTIEARSGHQANIKKLEELTKIRSQLAESKVNQSHAPALISGLFGISAVLLVLNYEKADIVTSKAFSLATGLFRGR